MLRTETVTLLRRIKVGRDVLGNDVYEEVPEDVSGVLVSDGAQTDLTDPNRLEGVEIAYTLDFRRSWLGVHPESLTGCAVIVRGKPCEVVRCSGDNRALAPTPWGLRCEVKRTDG